jgi:two-component system, sensor histidine kinase LadS
MKKLFIIILFNFLLVDGISQHRLDHYRDSDKRFSINTINNIPFVDFNQKEINFGKDSAKHWFKVRVSNPEKVELVYYLEINSPWLDSVSFISENGKKAKTLSWKTPLWQRYYEHPNFILPLSLKAQSDTTFFFNFFKKTMLINGTIEIKREAEFLDDKVFDYSFFGFFGGITFTVFLFSMLLYIVNKERIYLYYSLYAILHLLFNLIVQGYFLKYYQGGIGPILTANEFASWILWFSQMSLMYFVKAFLWENTNFPSWLSKVWKITNGLMFSIIFLKIVWIYYLQKYNDVPNWILVSITFCFLSSIITGFLLSVVALIKRINPSSTYAYFIGITPFFFLSLSSYLRNLGIIKNHWLMGQYTQMVCISFDILVLMVGMGFRYKKMRLEKDKQTELAIANKTKLLLEKERISRDLHDSVGSQLTVISTGLDNAAYHAEKQSLKTENLSQISENVREAVQSLRDSIWATHQHEISIEDFESRLKTYISRIANEKIKFNIDLQDKSLVLNALSALNLFRITQEAIQNSLKHSQATKINISGKSEFLSYQLQIKDNGKGFEPVNVLNSENFGISNMKKRTEEIGGKIDFKTQNGTTVTICFEISR